MYRIRTCLTIVALLCLMATAANRAGAATGTVVTVSPVNLNGWTYQHDNCGSNPSTSSVTFVDGPATPPIGSGSLQFSIGTNGDSFEAVRYPNYAGVKLSSLTTLTYATYIQRFISGQAPYLTLAIDGNNDGTWDPINDPSDDALFFEPVYQTGGYGMVGSLPPVPNQGNVALNQWQTWDALHGGWWSNYHGAGGPPLTTLQAYATQFPDARIINTSAGGGVRIAAGCGLGAWDNFLGNADALTVGVNGANTTFNFDLHTAPPTSKEQCKDGGWKTFNNPPFENQGDCVSYVAKHSKHGGHGDGGDHGGHGDGGDD